MGDIQERYEELTHKIEKLKRIHAELSGQRKVLMADLKSKFGYKTEAAAKAGYKKRKAKLAKAEARIEAKLDEVEKLVDAKLNELE